MRPIYNGLNAQQFHFIDIEMIMLIDLGDLLLFCRQSIIVDDEVVQSCYNLNDLLALSNKTTRVILLRMI
jgi:predicted PP-loop superfamily ATPase